MKKYKSAFTDAVSILIGSIIFAISVNTFTVPNLIAPGGASGVATVINHLTNIPVGTLMILINLPLFAVAIWKFGFKEMLKTLIAALSTSIVTDITAPFLPKYTGDVLLAAIFGGVAMGVGLGLIYMRGMTTGGSDILARLFELKFPHISYGKMITCIDGIITVAAAVVFRDGWTMLYAWITIYIFGMIADKMMAGPDTAKLVHVISSKKDQIAKEIFEKMDRGATFINASGAYTGENRDILFIVVRRYELPRLKLLIKEIDSSAFIIIGDVSEVLGEGFKPITMPKK